MSQAQDMAAINGLIVRTTPTNAAATAIQASWLEWYGSLPAFERDYDPDALYDAKLRRDAFNRAMSNGAVSAPGPIAPVTPTPKPTIKRGSRDPDGSTAGPVHEWQAIVGAVPVDGIFGSKTESLTKTWQKAHGLVNDGIVGPLTWSQALNNSLAVAAVAAPVAVAAVQAAQNVAAAMPPSPAQQVIASAADKMATAAAVAAGTPPAVTKAKTEAVATQTAAAIAAQTPVTSSSFPVLREGSKGDSVRTWQAMIGITADGVFGPDTAKATRAWQTAHGLVADGVVGPATWTAAALPQNAAINSDPIGNAVGKATNAVIGAFSDLRTLTPNWLKWTAGGLLGWSGILAIGSLRRKKSV